MSNRMKIHCYRDQVSETRLKHISVNEGTECALLFAFLDRYSANTHRCGIWKHSPEDMALSLGMDSGDEVRGMLGSLQKFGILFDAETNLVLNHDQVEQYRDFARNIPNNRKGVEDHLSTLPDSWLKDRFCRDWGFDVSPVDVFVKDSSDLHKEREVKGDVPNVVSHDVGNDVKGAQVSQKRGKQDAKSEPNPFKSAKGVKNA